MRQGTYSKISKLFFEVKIDTLPSSLSLIKNVLGGSKDGHFCCFHNSCQLGLKYIVRIDLCTSCFNKFFSYRTILPAFEKCLDDVKSLETVFTEKKDHLKVRYGKYCMNHPKVGYILNEFDVYFNVRDLK